MAAAPHGPVDPPLERAIAALESALAVVFARADQVRQACDAIAREAPDWSRPECAAGLQRLAALVRTRRGPAIEPVVTLLRDAARSAARPWPVLEALLSSQVDDTCLTGLDLARRLVESGSLAIDQAAASALARMAESGHSPLAEPRALDSVAALLARTVVAGASAGNALRALFLSPGQGSLRRLAARALDRSGAPPGDALVRQVLAPADADVLAPVLAYTRATHLDLAGLVQVPGEPAPIAECFRAAARHVSRDVLADIVGELGWGRVNLGLDVRRWIGVSVDGSLPFQLTPSMAAVVEALPGARRESDHLVAIGHGGARDAEEASPAQGDAVARFRALNLAHAEVLGDILDVAPLDAGRVRTVLRKMDGIVAEYASLFAARSDECAMLPGLYDALKRRILAEIDRATPGQPLTMELTRLVQMFEDPPSMAKVQTLHGLKRYLHQRGLALGFGLLEAGHGTNRTADLALCSSGRVLSTLRRIEYVNFEPAEDHDPQPGGGVPVPYAVAIVADAFARQLLAGSTSLPRVRAFLYGNEVHYFVSFRNHPVFIRVDYSPPLGGGMIDLAYYGVSKFEIDSHPAIALEGIQAFFRRLDFFVEVDTTRIHARYDKERARDLADICEKAEALFRLVPYLMDVDWVIGSLDLPDAARRAVGSAWADLFARWGVLPTDRLLTADRLGVLAGEEARPEGPRELRWTGSGPYTDTVSARPRATFPAEVHAALAERGFDLPLVERERELGQVSLERHLLGPVGDAVERGELVEAPDGPRPAPCELFRRQHEADRFAEMLAGDAAAVGRAARLARLATALERTLTFETTGSVNGYEVQRARLVLRGASGALFALRDGAGIFRLALYAPGGVMGARRSDTQAPWEDIATCDVGRLASLLRRNNFLPSWIDAAGDDLPEALQLQAVFATPNRRARLHLPSGARSVECLKASPGRATGPARLGIGNRRPEDFEGAVLFSATLRPEDQACLHHAVAIVGTGGGILSHAGLMAVQCGRPALIMPGTWREETGGQASIVYRRVEFDEAVRTVGGFEVVERRGLREYEERLREGDLVVVDADGGLLQVLGQAPTALALHEGLRALEASARGLATASDPAEILAQRGRGLRAMHHLERLVARMADPVLVQHVVRELIDHGGAVRDRARLLRLLQQNPAGGDLAARCLRQASLELEDRCADAHARARRLVPSARGPDEVLQLRGDAVRARALLEQVRDLLPACGLPPAADTGAEAEALDELVVRRLTEIHRSLLDRLSGAGPDAGADPSTRHVLAIARDLGELLDAPPNDRALVERLRHALARRDRSRVAALSSRLVLWPLDGGLDLEPLAGSKAANLAELGRLGAASYVPPWFVVTDRALAAALDAPAPHRPGTPWSRGNAPLTLREAIDAVVTRADADPPQKATLIRQLWTDVTLPAAVVDAVVDGYRRLAPGETPFVAMRSSAREEDTRTAVRAGEFDTFLFVRGEAALVEHLRLAWSGLWTARAIHDRAVGDREGLGEGGGVIVQRIVASRVSGVLQTTNVAGRRTREMTIDVGLGLGEGVVSGAVSADHVVVSKDEDPEAEPLRFHYVTADKRERVVFDERRGAGTMRADVLSHQRLRPALEYTELVELVRLATRLEAAYGYPLDMEFGLEGASLWLLQVRPVPGSRRAWSEAVEALGARARGATRGAGSR